VSADPNYRAIPRELLEDIYAWIPFGSDEGACEESEETRAAIAQILWPDGVDAAFEDAS
jgi:hypothetical protein